MTGRRVGALAVVAVLVSCSHGSTGAPAAAVITTVAGRGVGKSLVPAGLATDGAGNVFIADAAGNRVVKLAPSGDLTTVAGTGAPGFSGDGGDARSAKLTSPGALAVDRKGNVFVVDTGNGRVRRIDTSGRITTVAGDGQVGVGRDGVAATSAPLDAPRGLAVDPDSRLVIADTDSGRIRRVDAAGQITTIAGGDVGAPSAIAYGGTGSLFAVLDDSKRIVAVSDGGAVDVPGGDAFAAPVAIAIDRAGDLIVAEADPARVVRIDRQGELRTLAEGPAPPQEPRPVHATRDPVNYAGLSDPAAVAVDTHGAVFVADAGNNRVRKISGAAVAGYASPPSYVAPPFVSGLEPAQGGAAGETQVVMHGRGFIRDATSVRFGAVAGRVVGIFDDRDGDSILLVDSPLGRAGATVDVTVSTAGGPSKSSRSARFTYVDGWERRAPMAVKRSQPTATLLDPPACHALSPPTGYPCGNVVVIGDSAESSEIYDPARDAWRAVDGPGDDRVAHTATLLGDGRVLVAGGKSGPFGNDLSNALDSTKIFDPTTGSWTDAGNLAQRRFEHTATLLDGAACRAGAPPAWCGKVLVAGGTSTEFNHPPLAEAELFDPATNSWSAAGQLQGARGGQTASLLRDARVVVIGGYGDFDPDPKSQVNHVLSSAELYDPATNAWTTAGALAVARFDHTATVLANGQVLVVGGVQNNSTQIKSAELFDPAGGTFRAAGIPRAERGVHTASLLADGRVVVAGGGPTLEPNDTPRAVSLPSVEVYDPATNRWTETRPLNTARSFHAAVVLDGPACRAPARPAYCGAVLVAGGHDWTHDPTNTQISTSLASTELYR